MKRNFAKARMNKDADERTLQNGEYRDALNIQVSTSDTGDVGALQNIKGNTKIDSLGGGDVYSTDDGVCVGMVKHVSTDKIYYFISGKGDDLRKDYILEYDYTSDTIKYVFVDIYESKITGTFSGTSMTVTEAEKRTLRPGMRYSADGVDYTITEVNNLTVTLDVGISTTDPIFTHRRVLELPKTGLITGVNILEDTLFWTDNASEPKRINIARSIAGTGGSTLTPPVNPGGDFTGDGVFVGDNSDWHTRFVEVQSGTADTLGVLIYQLASGDPYYPRHMSLQDITVVRKAPKQALKTKAFNTIDERVDATTGYVNNVTIWNGTNPPGGFIDGLTFEAVVDFRYGDLVTFSVLEGPGTDGRYDIKARVVEPAEPPVDGDGVIIPLAVGHKFKVLSINPELTSAVVSFEVNLDAGEGLLEDKFARFSYRYKYQDGEYSSFAPWSEITFRPGNYEYIAQDGFNKGMINTIRNLTLSDYTPVNMPYGVTDIDLLYKETGNPTVYTVKTVKPTDAEYRLETDIVHAVVPSNQLLRPWDNVPRMALAQEVSANRLIYGNYLHGRTVVNEPTISVDISTSTIDAVESGLGGSNSLKSLRQYQVGVVFSDKYGRETPIMTNEQAAYKIPVLLSASTNKLNVGLSDISEIPSWAEYCSYYIKEPTVEYYTLAMDRWYNAADGNVWISFPSSERNKLDEETFLYLKKAHGNNIPVRSGIEYKILAIENEAPDFIKTVYTGVGNVENTVNVNNDPIDNIGTSEGGYPLIGTRVISIPESSISTVDLAGFADHEWRLRFFSTADVDEIKSNWYDVDKVTTANDKYFFHLHGTIGEDLAFATVDGQPNTFEHRILNANEEGFLRVGFHKGTVKSRPEFDGRFFVKIAKDTDVTNYITAFEGDDWVVFEEEKIGYINNNCYTTLEGSEPMSFISPGHWHGDASNALANANHPTEHTNSIPDGESPYVWGDAFDANGPTLPTATNLTTNTHDALNGGAESARNFWAEKHGTFFIDRCSAFSWSGMDRHLPGNYYDGGDGGGYDEGYWNGVVGSTQDQIDISAQQSTGDYGFGFDVTSGGNNFWDQPSVYNEWAVRNIIKYGISNVFDDTLYNNPGDPHGLPSRGLWNTETNGYMDISWTGFTQSPHYLSVNINTLNQDGESDWWLTEYVGNINRIEYDANYQLQKGFIETLFNPGCKFRFSRDPDHSVYTVEFMTDLLNPPQNGNFYTNNNENLGDANGWDHSSIPYTWSGFPVSEYRHGHYGIRNYRTNSAEGQWEPMNLRQRWTLKVNKPFGKGIQEYDPTTGTKNPDDFTEITRALRHDGSDFDAIQILTPTTVDDDGNDISGGFTRNPAVWETKPKESVDIDIYYQASDIIPLRLKSSKNENEDLIPSGSTFVTDGSINTVESWSLWNKLKLTSNLAGDDDIDGEFNVTTPNGRVTKISLSCISSSDEVTINDTSQIYQLKHTLKWSNCWSFGNGVESDRIRDDYNAPQVDNGVKASTVLAEQIKEERRKHGLIWSGIYNSTSGVNDTNQFIMAEAITKDLNPSYGSIQRLLNRDTRLVMFCEDKVLRGETNKDVLYNADGSANVIASSKVVGNTQPYAGDYGISKNPESLAVAPATAYFTDASRGRVLALSTEGVRPISSYGMESYFLRLKTIANGSPLVGTFDDKTREYNLSTPLQNTVSYSEMSKSWVSFKSFLPETGVSLNNEFYTFAKGNLWKHHHNSVHNSFYGEDSIPSTVTVIFSDTQGSVKSFNTMNYEGSRAKITAFEYSEDSILTGDYSVNEGLDINETTYDGEYFNLADRKGWYVESVTTDMETGGVIEFKEKEGKWFGVPTGNDALAFPKLDRFATQGLGVASSTSYSGTETGDVTVTLKNSSSSSSGTIWD